MESAWFALIGTVVGALIGAVPTILIGKMNLKAEKERRTRELGIQMALADYQAACNAELQGVESPASSYRFIMPAYQLIKKLMDENLSPEEFEDAFEDARRIYLEALSVVYKAES